LAPVVQNVRHINKSNDNMQNTALEISFGTNIYTVSLSRGAVCESTVKYASKGVFTYLTIFTKYREIY
jgi:hypothetical protein